MRSFVQLLAPGKDDTFALDGMTPSHGNVDIIVLPRIGVPLSGCIRERAVDIAVRAGSRDERRGDVCRFVCRDVPANDAPAPDVHDGRGASTIARSSAAR
jgi:hypothetical protein